MTQNLNPVPSKPEVLDRSVLLVGQNTLDQLAIKSLLAEMDSPNGPILLGIGDVDHRSVGRGQQPSFLHLDEWPFYLQESHRPRPGKYLCYDKQSPWPPVPVDPVVAKRRDLIIYRAHEKRERKKLKRLAAAGKVKNA